MNKTPFRNLLALSTAQRKLDKYLSITGSYTNNSHMLILYDILIMTVHKRTSIIWANLFWNHGMEAV